MTRTMSNTVLGVCLSLALIAPPVPGFAQVQDVIWEKTYCLDSGGTEIGFLHASTGSPPQARQDGLLVRIEGDRDWLNNAVSQNVAQFLFTRACLDAATLRQGGRTGNLECETKELLERRYSWRSKQVFTIVSELGRFDSTRDIAKNLRSCT